MANSIVLSQPADENPLSIPGRILSVSWRRFVLSVVVLIPILIIWMSFLAGDMRTFKVISASMDPTLHVGDYVLMSRTDDCSHLRGRTIAFHSMEDPNEILTKRVVATQGDLVTLHSGRIYVNHVPETVSHEPVAGVSDREWRVGKNEIFVVGDNRNNSYDSIDYGTVPGELVIGVLTYRYWPVGRFGAIR